MQARSRTRSSASSTAFAEGTGGAARPIVDLNFNLEPEGILGVARALEPFGLLWLEVDLFDPAALALVRQRAPMPVCSGENLYGVRGFRPFLEAAALDVASVDVIWNGFHQAKKIADLAETFEVNCAPHNYYSHLATLIAAQWCAAIPNARILEIDVDDVPWREELVTVTAGDPRRRARRALRARVGRRRRRGRPARAPLARLSACRGRSAASSARASSYERRSGASSSARPHGWGSPPTSRRTSTAPSSTS